MKFSKPNIKIKLSSALLIVFLVVVLFELFVLYRALYSKPEFAEQSSASPAVRVNLDMFEKTKNWLEEREAYQKPDYNLQEGDTGRENPFLEYR